LILNIFFVDSDPEKAAQSLVDRHVVKMILESAQLLSTAHRVIDGIPVNDTTVNGRKIVRYSLQDGRDSLLYKSTHQNHPCAVWIRQSVENYIWLVDHLYALIDEYNFRYDKIHKVRRDGLDFILQSPPYGLKNWDFVQPPLAMPDEYKLTNDIVGNYREYYRKGKSHLFSWTKRQPPSWI
jgi:hypothetical protein